MFYLTYAIVGIPSIIFLRAYPNNPVASAGGIGMPPYLPLILKVGD